MKKKLILLFTMLHLTCFSQIDWVPINNIKAQDDNRDRFLVDKIYDYHNNLIAEYFYDNDNRLIKKIVTDNPGVNRRWVDEFEYENNRISKIKHDDQTYNFDYDIIISYNSQGQLIRRETYINELIVGHLNFHYENDLVVSIYSDNTLPFETDTIFYDNSGNVSKHIHIRPKLDIIGQPIPGEYVVIEYNYEYDSNPRPNFGIDYLFIYNPLPYTEIAEFERGLSINNMTKAINEKNTWIYTYNEYGLPETIETIWDDIPTVDPMILRITYKQIKVSISEFVQESEKINVYPNPVKNFFIIESGDFDMIKVYETSGKEVFSQNAKSKTMNDISHLPNGIYNVCIFAKSKIIGKGKIMKQ